MSRMTFTLRQEPPERLDLSPLTPQALAGKGKRDILALVIGTSKLRSTVGDVFTIRGDDPTDIVFEGGSERFDGIGTGMRNGAIRVIGDAGAKTGRQLAGGLVSVEGNVGPHAGSAMTGGRLEIAGNAGDHLGAPLTGEMRGVAGGELIVRGRAGSMAGDRMRRGLIVILKGAGDYAGCRMIAGTLVVAGKAGAMPGYGMRRGTILLDREPELISPSFVECGSPDIAFAGLMDRFLAEQGLVKRLLTGRAPRRLGGDNAVLGLGEILFPA